MTPPTPTLVAKQGMWTNPAWDKFTTDPNFHQIIKQQISAATVFSPFFDAQLSWFPNAVTYWDSLAIYTDPTRNTAQVNAHPEWILKDANGNKVYIPWGSPPLPQYAADIGNLDFIAAAVGGMLQALALPTQQTVPSRYAGLFLDDVNVSMNLSDANLQPVVPIDPRTGAAMTPQGWTSYFCQYLAKIRAAVQAVYPNAWLMQNTPWWTVDTANQAKTADYIILERGPSDAGITGGTGFWSLYAFLNKIDAICNNGAGPAVAFGDYQFSSLLYSLPIYWLAMQKGLNFWNLFGFSDGTPDKWDANALRLFNTDMGKPLAPRSRNFGLWRRDFQHGLVLVAEPGAGPFTLVPDKACTDAYTGAAITSITLQPKSGGVYLWA